MDSTGAAADDLPRLAPGRYCSQVRTEGLQAIIAAGAPAADRAPLGDLSSPRVSEWLASATGGRDDAIEPMLASLGWSLDNVAADLGESRLDPTPPWAVALDDFLQALPPTFADLEPQVAPGAEAASEWRPDPARDPLLSIWNGTLIAGLALLPPGPNQVDLSDEARTDLAVSLVGRVLACVVRALEPELVVARALNLPPGEALPGDRASWMDRLTELPGLAHPLGSVIASWYDSTAEMLRRLDDDIEILTDRIWHGARPRAVLRFSPDAGDPHQGGRSVCLIRFDGEQRVVYKPKPQAGSLAWQALLSWCAQQPALRRNHIDIGIRTVVDRGDYGWDQTLRKDTAPATPDEAVRWLKSYGALIRLLEIVEAADMWFDNLLTSDGLPQFIDVETVLQPRVADMSPASTLLAETAAPGGAVSMRLALPDGGFEDIGGLRPVSLLRLPFTERVIGTLSSRTDGYGADGIMQWTPSRWRPDIPDGVDVAEQVLRGYAAVDEALGEDPSSAIALVTSLARSPCRVVLRSTFTCYVVTRESLRPEVLGSGIDREIALARLLSPGAQALTTAQGPAHEVDARRLLAVGAADRGALRRMDIPLVRHDPCSRGITLDDGSFHEDWYDGTPLDRSIARIRTLELRALRTEVLRALIASATAAGGAQAQAASDTATERIVAALIAEGVDVDDARAAIGSLRA